MSDYSKPISVCQITPTQTIDIRHTVLWPALPREHVILNEDSSGVHFGGCWNGELVSVASVFIDSETQSARLRKFATLPDHRRHGIGSAVIHSILSYLAQRGIQRFWCDARSDAIGFYSKFYMEQSGKPFYKRDVEYVVMSREIEK
ncbi:GNAT family N-acetyltransferase [Thaumasiovibrio sp. DFM-14]|uniref:GNAT family N-acetyltransferase n=1 Tax=Thaumasiovibrio sp. DFM-14 TaxID=3384792 RepID=UPI0039A23E00